MKQLRSFNLTGTGPTPAELETKARTDMWGKLD